jgi:hypothetical protein
MLHGNVNISKRCNSRRVLGNKLPYILLLLMVHSKLVSFSSHQTPTLIRATNCTTHCLLRPRFFSENQLICASVSYSTINSSLLFSAQTPLHMASERGHIKVCQFLVAFNADTEARSMYAVPEVAVIFLHLACPSHSMSAARAIPPSKKRSKMTEPMLLRISAASLCQNKQRTHVNTNRIVFSFLSPRIKGGKRERSILVLTVCMKRFKGLYIYNNLLKRFSVLVCIYE